MKTDLSKRKNFVESDAAPVIWDNQDRTAADFLRQQLAPGVLLRAASAYFSIYGYNALKPGIDEIGKMRFLFGDPKSAASPDPLVDKTPPFELTEDGLKPTETLQQKALAAECAKWIEEKAEVRTVTKVGFMHGKMYHISGGEDGECTGGTECTSALAGSSNFTARGLGATENSNLELNLAIQSSAGRDEIAAWFDGIWNNKKLTRDAKEDVLKALARLAKNYSPEFLYYKTLFELFYDRIREREEAGEHLRSLHFYETEVWKKLYKFQRDGVHGAIHRLSKHNGCIIADSVGLGKTFEALAVIKYYELSGANCLVLCPKRLEENWKRYGARYERKNNPLAADKLNYRVLAHTDLSRTTGEKDGIRFDNFNWGAYDLVIIDESHNFRNTGSNRYDKEANLIGKSRYNLLMDNVVTAGVKTRVLMLSATPVNTNLTNLRNQIKLMTEGRNGDFAKIGIPSLDGFFSQAQKNFNAWEKMRDRRNGQEEKAALLEKLGGEFLILLDAVSIARSRHHIEAHYPEVTADLGGFPRRAKPENRAPATDSEGKLSYDDMYDRISKFNLSIYSPSEFLKDEKASAGKKASPRDLFGQEMREKFLISMLRINFLKRLESSAESFRLTLERTLGRIDTVLEKIDKMTTETTFDDAPDDEDYGEDEDFFVGKRVKYHLSELKTEEWKKALQEDRVVLQEIYDIAKSVNESRDGKLHELKKALLKRIQSPSIDKEGRQCRKALIFTAFSDTAKYLYQNLTAFADKHGVKIALVTGGGDGNKTNADSGSEFGEILDNFSPRTRKGGTDADSEIDVLIATDCISEGQNLQDCDLVINYDIHWNPTRLIQRFGRIDRIGSIAQEVRMINFWPTKDLERYLDLKNRVEARMALADATATGQDNIFDDDTKEAAQMELDFRNNQLRRMREDADIWDGGTEEDDRLQMSDFSLDDFIAQLIAYLEKNKDELENTPRGIYALTAADRDRHESAVTGVVFCLRHKTADLSDKVLKASPLHPHYLVYIGADGKVRYGVGRAKQILEMMGALCRGEQEASTTLTDAFSAETKNGREMGEYNRLIENAIKSIASGAFGRSVDGLIGNSGSLIPAVTDQPRMVDDFELVTWLIIKNDA